MWQFYAFSCQAVASFPWPPHQRMPGIEPVGIAFQPVCEVLTGDPHLPGWQCPPCSRGHAHAAERRGVEYPLDNVAGSSGYRLPERDDR